MEISLADKTLVMIVGPAAIGKSTLMSRVVELDGMFAAVSGFTSRPKRANDETGRYRYITANDIESVVSSPETLQYAVHPTTRYIYGTQLQDYTATYNLLDTLSSVAEQLRHLPFKRTVTISLTAPYDDWQQWFFARYPISTPERQKRLKEAVTSIEWSIAQSQHHWLVNHRSDLDGAAENLIRIVTEGTAENQTEARQAAEDLLFTVKSLLSYEQKESYDQENPA